MSAEIRRLLIAGSDQAFDCFPGDTVLRAAQRAGLGFPYECNVGSCGNCRFELVEGELATAWPQAPAWTDKDRQRRRHLGCQSTPNSNCTIKLRLADAYAPVHRPIRSPAVLTGVRVVTHDISEFAFELETPMCFEPGQYALVQMPGVEGVRAWSMSNAPEAGQPARQLEFQVRRVPQGAGSEVLFDMALGTLVEIDGPYGMAWLRRDAPRGHGRAHRGARLAAARVLVHGDAVDALLVAHGERVGGLAQRRRLQRC
jgi:toluene monooxygenase electron transfer component